MAARRERTTRIHTNELIVDDRSPTGEVPMVSAKTRGSNPFNLENPSILDIAPNEPMSLGETGLKIGLLSDIALKFLYYTGTATGAELSDTLKLPWTNVVDQVIDFVATEKLVDLRGGKGFGRMSVDFMLTAKGREHARDALERTTYVGPAPVPIEQYSALIQNQTRELPVVNRKALELALSHLVVPASIVDKLGPAVNSGRSLFLYGPPGNGKTSIAESVSGMFGGEAYIPYAIEVDGQIVKVFDELVHHVVPLEAARDGRRQSYEMDRRWQICRRPSVIACRPSKLAGGSMPAHTISSSSCRFRAQRQ